MLTTAPFSPTRKKPYSSSLTASLMQPRSSASPSAWRILRSCTNPLHEMKKAEVLYQPPSRKAYSPPHINIDGNNLNEVEHFIYLGSVISNDATVSKDPDNRLFKASISFGRLSKTVWQSRASPLHKDPGIQSRHCSTLLYGAETWVLYRKHIRLLERFHHR